MKKLARAVPVLILLVLLLYLLRSIAREEPDRPTEPPRKAGPADPAPPPVLPERSEAASRAPEAAGAGEGSPTGAETVESAMKTETSAAAPGQVVDAPEGEAAPAIRRNPRDPPRPDPRVRPRGGRPPMGPTGHWQKFPPAILRGRASLSVLVTDEDGKPVPGADVVLGPPDIRGESAVSYAHLRKLGKTDGRGRLTAERLPEGTAAVAGNLAGLLNGRFGLDARSAVGVTLKANEIAEAELSLPLSLGSLGRIEGTVLGPGEKPLRKAQVLAGFFRALTDREGAFEIPYVAVGAVVVSASRGGGLERDSREVEVLAGETTRVDFELAYREPGSLSLAGSVIGPAGEPVPEAHVYVIATSGSGRGTVRSERTDEHGRFVMESLPDRLAEAEVRVQGSRFGYHSANVVFEDGLDVSEIELRLPVRLTRLKLVVLDAATGEPLDRCRFEARKEGRDRPAASFSSRGPEGLYETWIEEGVAEFLVEAPDHEAHRAQVAVPGGGAEFEYIAKLVAAGEPSVEVSLTVVVTDETTGEPVETVKIRIVDPGTGAAVSSFENHRPGGRFTMPAPSGNWRLRVEADGYEVAERDLELDPENAEAEVAVRLRPR